MAEEVGVLELSIRDNSNYAAPGVQALADALKAVKEAVKGGLKLSAAATQIEKIATVVNEKITETTISRLNEFSSALSNLKGLENVRISLRSGDRLTTTMNSIETGRQSMEAMGSEANTVGNTVAQGFAEAKERVEEITDAYNDLKKVNLGDIKASGQNGAFANASEEMQYLKNQIERSKAELKQWEDTYEETKKRIKYNGPSEERNNMLTHAEEGFYKAMEAVEQYSTALDELEKYVANYIANTTEMTSRTKGLEEAMENVLNKTKQLNHEMHAKYDKLPDMSFEDYLYGYRYRRGDDGNVYREQVENDMMSNWLQGNGSLRAQKYAIKQMAMEFNTTTEDIQERINSSLNANGPAQSLENFKNAEEQVKDVAAEAEGNLKNLDKELKTKKNDASEATSAFNNFKQGLSNMINQVKESSGPLRKFGNEIWRIIKRMAIRAAIRQITGGIKEGVQNMYEYSKLVGNSFAPAMDSAATSLQQMKNSIGAALAPLLQSLIPLLNTVVSWFITAINYVNQFFALLRGQSTWTSALPASVEAFNKQKKAANGASKAMKDLLADWDELNIIQNKNKNNGGSGSSSNTPDYSAMFQENNQFDERIRKIVDWIKTNFDKIKDIVKKVGIAILGWKISSALSGVLATLAGFVSTGALIAIEWDVSTLLNKQYFDTGEIGWLVADLLQALIGGVLMQKVLGSVLAGKYAFLGIPLMLTVNAMARIVTFLGSSDVSALSKEGLISSIVSSLEIGGVAAYLAHTYGYSLGTSLAGGAALALVTFGAVTNLKASVEAIKSDVTEDTIKSVALGSLSIGIGAAAAAKLAIKDLSLAKAAGFGAATGAAAGLLTIGATLLVSATVESVKSGVDKEQLGKTAIGSLATGAGVAIVAKMGGATLAGAAAAGGWVTVGAVAAVAAIVAVSTALKTEKKDVHWGSYVATQEEIQNWVDTQIFNVKLPVAIKLAKDKIADTRIADSQLQEKVGKVLPIVNALMLGFDVEASIENLKSEIWDDDGLINKLNSSIEQKKIGVEAALVLVPIKDGNGKDASAEYYKEITQGWTNLQDIMKTLGEDLASAMATAYNDKASKEAKDSARKTIAEYTEAMLEVSTAISTSEYLVKMNKEFKEGLSGLSGQSMGELIKYYKEQKEASSAAMSEEYDSYFENLAKQLSTNEILLDKAKKNGGSFAGKDVKYYEDEIKRIKELNEVLLQLKESSIESAEAYYTNGKGFELIRAAMFEHGIVLTPEDLKGKLRGVGNINQFYDAIVEMLFEKPDLSKDSEAKNELTDYLFMYLQEIIGNAFNPQDAQAIIDLISLGIFDWSEIFSLDARNKIIDELSKSDDTFRPILEALFDELFGSENKFEVPLEDSVKIQINGIEFEVSDSNAKEKLRQKIEEALTDDVLTTAEREAIIYPYGANGSEMLEAMLREMGIEIDKTTGQKRSFIPEGVRIAGMPGQEHMGGFTPVNPANTSLLEEPAVPMYTNPYETQTQQEDSMSTAVEKGTRNANEQQNDILTDIMNAVRQILNKKWVVNVNPSTDWGEHNDRSNYYYGRMTGYQP